ncbi:protein Skeletor, isoforms B/C isoform X2 [Cimex lectularius]|uniref:Knickkopf n=1 Tax=Cimex lectularius TaxID=79782 RepID=A0A8I6TJ60_CIMLE|nr:protein Skeletor, isoforms B/C isoform X2 [Cimex lectularius]
MLFHLLLGLTTVAIGECRPKDRGVYYGRLIGTFQEYAHGIRGTAYAVDDSTIFVKGFSYDGTGPDAFFWVGSTPRPSPEGYIIPYPEDYVGRDPPVLRAYNKTDVILRLPQGKKLKDIKWLSVWCRRFTVNFGEVFIPPNLVAPKTRVLPEFKRLAHRLQSGNITILDAKTFYIPNLHYDGAGPDAYFWVGNGPEPHDTGTKVPSEKRTIEPLSGYYGNDIEIVLPGNLTVYDIDWLAVWCVQYKHNFGHVYIPKDLDVPPALGQTKITTTSVSPEDEVFSNCRELLDERMQVEWSIEGEWVQITLSAKIREDQYMAFGISGEQGRSTMVGGDVVVAYYNKEKDSFHAVDYYMSATAQCDGHNGVCPDYRIGGRDDVELIKGERRHGITTVIYRRALHTNEPINDRPIPRTGETSVIAAIGPLNSNHEAYAHAVNDKTNDDIRIDFGSKQDGQCTNSLYHLPEDEEIQPWPPAVIRDETVFSVRIGPTGGKRGYTPITGQPSWGIAWYINDLLIPEIYVIRGKTYTFVVEGGNDPTQPARYHPFYITDSPEGGFGQKSDIKQRQQRVFAGVSYDSEGFPYPTASGRYCEWQHKTVDKSETTETFKEYLETLRLECVPGEPAYLNWTVPMETPDILYYQCYTHNNLGWKIHVTNRTSASKAPSLVTDLSIAMFLLVTNYMMTR